MDEKLYILCEEYLNNELSSDEKIEFENQLQNDADIKEKFEIYKQSTRFLENKFDAKTTDFKENLKHISKNHFSESEKNNTKKIQLKPWYYAVAASAVLFLGMWFMMDKNSDYSEFYQHENANLIERGSSDKNLKTAQDAFNSKNYKVAVANFETVLKDNNTPEINCFYGVSLLEDSQFAKAEAVFVKLQSGTSIYKDKATWNLALLKLKQKQFEACKTYLKQIPEDAEEYQQAQKLFNKLD